ncbi:twin-arginine translocase subunit TatB [Helicobacter sp. 16-1353]|nr:twin-arginine translocase subunit TatB [Helicobacter sp. 16-1353]
MFGFSFGEVLIIAIIAVLFLGPDKLPKAFVDIAKFFKAVKKTINDAKDALDREVHISEIKQEALEYKKKFEQGAESIKNDIAKSGNFDEISNILNTPLDSVESNNKTNSINSMQELELETKKIASKVNLKPTTKKTESKIAKTKTKTDSTKKPAKPKTAKTDSTKSKTTKPKTAKIDSAESKTKTTKRTRKVSEQ